MDIVLWLLQVQAIPHTDTVKDLGVWIGVATALFGFLTGVGSTVMIGLRKYQQPIVTRLDGIGSKQGEIEKTVNAIDGRVSKIEGHLGL